MGVGAVMCWARLTCFYPHAKSGVFQSSLSILSLYSATCLTSFCPNISGLNVWVLFSYSWSWKFIETGAVKCQQLRPFYWEAFCFL